VQVDSVTKLEDVICIPEALQFSVTHSNIQSNIKQWV